MAWRMSPSQAAVKIRPLDFDHVTSSAVGPCMGPPAQAFSFLLASSPSPFLQRAGIFVTCLCPRASSRRSERFS